jgi:hypothetical protein
MCTYLGYVLPADCPETHRDAIFRNLGIRVYKRKVAGFDPKLKGVEVCYVNRESCDCGTVIGQGAAPPTSNIDGNALRAKYERKGWSETKIARAIADHKIHLAGGREAAWERQAKAWRKLFDYLQNSAANNFKVFWHEYKGLLEEEEVNLREAHTTYQCAWEVMLELPADTLLTIT